MTVGARDPMIGLTLDGRYEITERLARGGMATVYLGTDLRLTRTVAIKVMHVGMGDDDDFARKFDREARSAAKLSHPNVVSVFDQGIDDVGGSGGRPFIVMEYVEGRTLRSLMRRVGVVDPVQALTIMEAVLCALAAAHESGLVHRDIKPENVLIADRGSQIKVADFGLAKAITSQTATATAGVLIGTVSYLPPELVTHGRADARSDVYSAGVVLYEMLTGTKPHTGDTPIQVAYAHVHRDVPAPSSVRPDLPDYLDALVRHATARRPEDRPSDARGLLRELRAVRAKLRAGCAGDEDLTEVIAAGSPAVGEWNARNGIRMRHTPLPADWNPRTLVSPARSPLSPARTGPVNGLLRSAAPTAQGRSTTAPSAVGSPRGPYGRGGPRSGGGAAGTALAERDHARRTPPTPLSPVTPVESQQRIRSGGHDTGAVEPVTGAERRPPTRAHRAAVYRRRRGVVALLLVLLMTAGAAIAGWWLVEHRSIATPAVANLTAAQATEAIELAELQVGAGTEEFSETVPAGRVIESRPQPGVEIPRGSAVELVVSKGPDRTTAPTLAGRTVAEAKATLTAARLTTGAVSQTFHETIASGVVISASQRDGATLRPGTEVDLVVSKGRRPIPVGDWVGKPVEEAERALDRAGFDVEVSERHSDTVGRDRVISQDPRGGNGYRGDTVELVRSLGPELVVVPNVRSMGLSAAEKTLQEAGFTTARKAVIGRDSLGLGFVSYTDPAAGTKAPKGSVITMHYI